MTNRIYVKPADPEQIVREPDMGLILPPEGAWVERTHFWIRRLADGSVVEAKPPAKTARKSSRAAPAEADAS